MCGPAVVLKRTIIFGVAPRPRRSRAAPTAPRPAPRRAAARALRRAAHRRRRRRHARAAALAAAVGGVTPNRPPPCQSSSSSRSPSSSTRSFSQGTEPKPVGDMLSPKIGVTVTVYSPSDGNTCVHEHAAAGAERQPFDVVVLRRVFRRAVDDQRRRRRLADRQTADLLPAAETYASTSVDEMPERAGDVVEAVRRVVGRQVLRRVDVEVEQVADDVRVFGAVQAMQAGRRHVGRSPCGPARSRATRSSTCRSPVRAAACRRRHHAGAQLADDLLPGLGVVVDLCGVEVVERQLAGGIRERAAAGLGPFVVAR